MDLIKEKEDDYCEPDHYYREGHGLWFGPNWPKTTTTKEEFDEALRRVDERLHPRRL